MPGLLDFANTDDGMQGLGLLAAAAPSMAPMNFAGRLAQAAQGYGGLQDSHMKRLEAQQQIQIKNIALQHQIQEFAMQQPVMQALTSKIVQRLNQSQQAQQPDAQPSVMPYSDSPRDLSATSPAAPQSGMQPTQTSMQPSQQSSGGSMLPNVPDDITMWTAGVGGIKGIPKLLEEYNKPTDMMRNNSYMGISPAESAAAARAKMAAEGTLLARGGTTLVKNGVPYFTAPDLAHGNSVSWANGTGVMSQMPGAGSVIADVAEQQATGKNRASPTIGYDKDTGLPVNQTLDQQVQQAKGTVPRGPVTERNIRQVADVANIPIAPATQADLATVTAMLKAPNLPAKSREILAQERDRLATELQNPAAQGQTATAPSGTILPQQPAGFVSNANAAQEASAKLMHETYSALSRSAATAPNALNSIDKMLDLSTKKSFWQAGKLGTGLTAVSPDAAEYEKHRANLVAQLSAENGTGGTDAGRALTGESVPDFGKPQSAQQDGLKTLRNQIVAKQLKTDFLNSTYTKGDSKTFGDLSNQFDQNVSPKLVPLLTMQPSKSRGLLLQNMQKDPVLGPKLEWAAKNGLLK